MQNLVFLIDFVLLFLVTYHLRRRYQRGTYITTSAPSAIMAVGAMTWAVLAYLPLTIALFKPYIALELLVIWLLLADSYLQCYLQKHFYMHTRHVMNRTNMGTWIVATALVGLLWLKSFHEWDEIGLLLAVIALCIWVEYMRLMMENLQLLLRNPVSIKLQGMLFLLPISTQFIVVLLDTIFQDWLPSTFLMLLILIGYSYFVICFILTIRYYSQQHFQQVLLEWSPANSLMHGALSISGIACLHSHIISPAVIISTWIAAAALVIGIEGLALLRVLLQLRVKGFQFALWRYDTLQWQRSFSYSLFYAFTIVIEKIQPLAWKPMTFAIIAVGQYIVFGLVMYEVLLFLQVKFKPMVLKKPLVYKDEKNP